MGLLMPVVALVGGVRNARPSMLSLFNSNSILLDIPGVKPFLPKKLSPFLATHLFREMNVCWFMASLSFSLLLKSSPDGWNLNLRKNQSRAKMKARIRTR
jgi:hypothetical protein